MAWLTLAVFLVAFVCPAHAQYAAPTVPPPAAQSALVTPAEGIAANAADSAYGACAAAQRRGSAVSNTYHSNEEARRVRQMEAQERPLPEGGYILVELRMIELSLTKLAEVDSAKYGGTKGMSVLDLLVKMEAAGKPSANDNVLPSPDPKLIALV